MPAPAHNRFLGFIEMILRRLQSSPWQALYLAAIGFVLIPALRASAYFDGSASRLLVSVIALFVALRVVPAVFRKIVPFSSDLQAEWFTRRRIAKRYDSYQWRKLLWVGVGLGVYLVIFEPAMGPAAALAAACIVCGGLGTLAWRRVIALDPVAAELR